MYYGAIYTRCANGYDIVKRREEHNSGGYKLHGLSKELLSDERIDTNYLIKILEEEVPVNKDALLDDAFFYSAGDTECRFLTRFHYVTDVFRNFFIVQAFIGEYEDFYPFELFERESIWDAKDLSEEHYLTADTRYMPVLDIPASTDASTILADAIRFIENGRKQVFKQALAFLISQYDLEKSQRKYLVIRDVGEREIEYWIAALSSAVSPRMAADLTFATRMSAIQNTNRYAVDSSGRYQKTMDFERDPNSLRRIAMIVGAVDADRENANIIVRQNSPYVILDGATRTLSCSVDDSDPYFDFAASFSESFFSFCRQFVQAFGYTSPSKEIEDLYRNYNTLVKGGIDADYISSLKNVFSRPIVQKENLRWIYTRTKKAYEEELFCDPELLLSLSDELTKLASLFGCQEESEIEGRILNTFETVLFSGTNEDRNYWWSVISKSKYALETTKHLMKPEVFGQNESTFNQMPACDAVTVTGIYMDMQYITSNHDSEFTKGLCSKTIHICREMNDISSAKDFVCRVKGRYGKNTFELLEDVIRKNDPDSIFLLDILCSDSPRFPDDLSEVIALCSSLCHNGKTIYAEKLLFSAIQGATSPNQIEDLMDNVSNAIFFESINKEKYYTLIDSRIGFNMNNQGLSLRIQKEKPAEARCGKSAHIVALLNLGAKKKNETIEKSFAPYFDQGFPSWNNLDYINTLCNRIIRAKFTNEDVESLINRFLESESEMYFSTLVALIYENLPKTKNLWNKTIGLAALNSKKVIYERAFSTLVNILLQRKTSKRTMKKACKYLKERSSQSFYLAALNEVIRKKEEANPRRCNLFKTLIRKSSRK